MFTGWLRSQPRQQGLDQSWGLHMSATGEGTAPERKGRLIERLPRTIGRAVVAQKPGDPDTVGLIFPRDASAEEMHAWLQELRALVKSFESP